MQPRSAPTPGELTTRAAAVALIFSNGCLEDKPCQRRAYANNRVEADHGRLKARLGPMRGLKQDRNASVIIAGHAFVQNLRRGHDELATEEPANGG